MPTVVLCRHAESTWNREGRIQGWAPTDLTDRGREQARTLGDHLAGAYAVDRLLGSDLQRAQETARAIARSTGVEPTYHRVWRERDFGILQGVSTASVFERFPQHSLENAPVATAEEPLESGESLLDARERVLSGWRDLRSTLDPDETAVVVTHGTPIYLLVGHLKGQDLQTAILDATHDNAGVTEAQIDADREIDVVRENDTRFL